MARIREYYHNMIQKLKSHQTEEYMIDEFVYNTLKEFSVNLNKEIAIVLNRKGRIEEVIIEKKEFAELENQDSFPKKAALIFTRLSSVSHPSMLDLSTLIMKKYDYVMTISLKTEEATIAFWGRYLKEVETIGPHRIEYFYNLDISSKISEMDEKQREREKIHETLTEKEERALLVDVWPKSSSELDRHLLEELESLCKTAGVKVVDTVVQVRRSIDPAYFIGRGKAEEILSICQQKDIDVVIFNRELSPAQIKNLEELLLRKVIDQN